MCMSPKPPRMAAAAAPAPTPQAPPIPAAPPPVKTAKKVENKALKRRMGSSKRSGTSSLTVRRKRPTLNAGSSGSGANVSY